MSKNKLKDLRKQLLKLKNSNDFLKYAGDDKKLQPKEVEKMYQQNRKLWFKIMEIGRKIEIEIQKSLDGEVAQKVTEIKLTDEKEHGKPMSNITDEQEKEYHQGGIKEKVGENDKGSNTRSLTKLSAELKSEYETVVDWKGIATKVFSGVSLTFELKKKVYFNPFICLEGGLGFNFSFGLERSGGVSWLNNNIEYGAKIKLETKAKSELNLIFCDTFGLSGEGDITAEWSLGSKFYATWNSLDANKMNSDDIYKSWNWNFILANMEGSVSTNFLISAKPLGAFGDRIEKVAKGLKEKLSFKLYDKKLELFTITSKKEIKDGFYGYNDAIYKPGKDLEATLKKLEKWKKDIEKAVLAVEEGLLVIADFVGENPIHGALLKITDKIRDLKVGSIVVTPDKDMYVPDNKGFYSIAAKVELKVVDDDPVWNDTHKVDVIAELKHTHTDKNFGVISKINSAVKHQKNYNFKWGFTENELTEKITSSGFFVRVTFKFLGSDNKVRKLVTAESVPNSFSVYNSKLDKQFVKEIEIPDNKPDVPKFVKVKIKKGDSYISICKRTYIDNDYKKMLSHIMELNGWPPKRIPAGEMMTLYNPDNEDVIEAFDLVI